MENLVIKGRITATSNKVDTKFKQENPTKTAYVTVSDEAEKKKLIDFGLTEYTSKADGLSFFIIKLPQNVAIYVDGVEGSEPLTGSVETPNFSTVEGKDLLLNIIKGEHMNNDFFRLQAIKIEQSSDIVEVEQTNPFA